MIYCYINHVSLNYFDHKIYTNYLEYSESKILLPG